MRAYIAVIPDDVWKSIYNGKRKMLFLEHGDKWNIKNIHKGMKIYVQSQKTRQIMPVIIQDFFRGPNSPAYGELPFKGDVFGMLFKLENE